MLLVIPYLFNPRPAPVLGAMLIAGAIGVTVSRFFYRALAAHRLFALAAWGGALALYLTSLLPSVLPGDSGEFQLVPYVLGVPHPTGYPLWVLLGNLMSRLPIGSVAYRLNLLSALSGALAVSGLYLAARALSARPSVSLFAALAFAVTPTMWEQSVRAEKYALNVAFVTLTLWLLLQWRQSRQPRWLNLFALVYGLSLTHHRTMALMAPAFALFILLEDRTVLRLRRLPTLAALFVLPLSLYLALPILSSRNPPVNFLQPNTARQFFDLILANTYQGNFFLQGWGAVWPQLQQFGGNLLRQFTWPGLLLALGGLIALARRDRNAALLLLLALAAQIGFSINYTVPNNYVYYLPTFALAALVIAAGMETIMRWPAVLGGKREAVTAAALMMVLSLLPFHLWARSSAAAQPAQVYRGLEVNRGYVVSALSEIGGLAYIISDWASATALWYGQHVEGLAPQATIVVAEPLEAGWREEAQIGFSRGLPVYLARPLIGAAAYYALDSAGPMIQLRSESGADEPAPAFPLDITFGEDARLIGFDAWTLDPLDDSALRPRRFGGGGALDVSGGETLGVTLHWQALRRIESGYLVTLTLVDVEGHVWAQAVSRPVGQAYATTDWKPGERIADYHALPIDPFTPSGEYSLLISLGALGQKEGLPVSGASVAAPDQVEVLHVRVAKPLRPSLPAQMQPYLVSFGDAMILRGIEVPDEAAPGDSVVLMTYWQAVRASVSPFTVALQLQNDLSVVREEIVPPAGGWRAGEVFRVQHVLLIPSDARPGRLPLKLRLETMDGQPIPVQPGWARLPEQSLWLSGVNVQALPPSASNFSDLIRLRSFTVNQPELHPGETLTLTLEWQALKAIDQDYKVFVHVLAPDDFVLAQEDHQPVNNTYPTSRWSSGERVADVYPIQIPPGAPPAEYRIAVGLYLPSSQERLVILDPDRQVVGDRAIVTTIRIVNP